MIAPCDLPHVLFCSGARPMTAYLISLALAGLVAIILWESCA
jgi:hypothetical protein